MGGGAILTFELLSQDVTHIFLRVYRFKGGGHKGSEVPFVHFGIESLLTRWGVPSAASQLQRHMVNVSLGLYFEYLVTVFTID